MSFKRLISSAVILAFLHNASCLFRKGNCVGYNSQKNLNVNKFFSGTWYEIQTTPYNFVNVQDCGSVSFKKKSHLIEYEYNYLGSKLFSEDGAVYRESNETYYNIHFPNDYSDSKLYVFGTDYDNYAIVYSCSEESDSVVKERMSIFGRQRELPPKTKKTVGKILHQSEYSQLQITSRLESCHELGEEPSNKREFFYIPAIAKQAPLASDCFTVTPMTDLTTYRFFNWFWYEYNRTKNDFDSKTECGRFAYEHAPALPGDPELVVLDHRYPKPEYNFVIFGNATTTEDKKTTVTIQFPTDQQMSSYYVLGTDYEVALIYSCAKESSTVLKERSWILARYKDNVTVDQMLEIEATIDSQGKGFREKLSALELKSCKDIKPSTCYNVNIQSGFDISRFSRGLWNVVWKSKSNIGNETECGKVKYQYQPDQDQLGITFEYRNGKKFQGLGKLLETNGTVQILNVTYPQINENERSNYVIAFTDYENYAVIYNCWQNSTTKKEERLWVLSRSDAIPEEARVKISSDNYFRDLMEEGITC